MRLNKAVGLVLSASLVAFLINGCAKDQTQTTATAGKPAVVQTGETKHVYTGSVVGKSNKAKTISITVGKGADAKTMMVRFDDHTKGIENANKGEAAIIAWEERNGEQYATLIKPKLAKLPEGVSEIKAEELHDLLSTNTDLLLVDARPEMRYNQAHLPGAVSISVPKLMEKKAAVLPADKDKLLIFYCGGYT